MAGTLATLPAALVREDAQRKPGQPQARQMPRPSLPCESAPKCWQPLPVFTETELKLPLKRQAAKYFIERGNYMVSLQRALELPEVSAAVEARREELSLSGMPFSGREQERTVRNKISEALSSGSWESLVKSGAIKHFVPEEYVKNIEHGQYWVGRLSDAFGQGDIHKVGSQHYLEAGLKTYLTMHSNSPIKILQHYFPDEADPFLLAKKPNGFCASEENQAEAVRRLRKVVGKPLPALNTTDINSNGASGFLARAGCSPHKLVKTADPSIRPENMRKAPNNTYSGKILCKGKVAHVLFSLAREKGLSFDTSADEVQAELDGKGYSLVKGSNGKVYFAEAAKAGCVLRDALPYAATWAILHLLEKVPPGVKITTTILNRERPGFVKAYNGTSLEIVERERAKAEWKNGKAKRKILKIDKVSSADEAVFGKEYSHVVLHSMSRSRRHGTKWRPGLPFLSDDEVLEYLSREQGEEPLTPGKRKRQGKSACRVSILDDQIQLGIARACLHFFRDNSEQLRRLSRLNVSATHVSQGASGQKQTLFEWSSHGKNRWLPEVKVCMFINGKDGFYEFRGVRENFGLNGVESGNLGALAAVLENIRKAVSAAAIRAP